MISVSHLLNDDNESMLLALHYALRPPNQDTTTQKTALAHQTYRLVVRLLLDAVPGVL